MKMKYLYGFALATMLFSSCSEDMMDRINRDETSKTADKVAAKFQLTDAEVSTAYSTVNGAYAWYVSSYTEQLFGTGNNQLMKAELRQSSETASSTTFNNEWNSTYSNLHNLYQISVELKGITRVKFFAAAYFRFAVYQNLTLGNYYFCFHTGTNQSG